MVVADERVVCDACPTDGPSDATGYSKKDLTARGWRWYTVKDPDGKSRSAFVMCPACVSKYEPVWKALLGVA